MDPSIAWETTGPERSLQGSEKAPEVLSESYESYRSELRAAVYGAWRRVLTYDQFLDSFRSSIQRGLARAWYEGAGECGILPDELGPAERAQLQRYILVNLMAMGGFADQIYNFKSRDEGGKLRPHLDRLALWANRYNEVRTLAAAMACGDRKKMFVLGPTKEHCLSCAGFAGRVYRYSVWLANNALPQSRALRCGGWKCQCRLVDTDAPITKGRFPASLLAR